MSKDNSPLSIFTWRLINHIRRNRRLYFVIKSLLSIRKQGIKKSFNDFIANMKGNDIPLETCLFLSKQDTKLQKTMIFSRRIRISIVTSIFNIPEKHLKEMIESVLAQTYGNWELCLVDGSDKRHMGVKHICKTYTQKDNRIKYRKYDRNIKKSERLNKAIEMSTGDYIALLDQGDLLHPGALYEIMRVICREGADFIYSDEANFSGNNIVTFRHHKPDFAIDTLCSHNYIGHAIAFSRKLFEKAGTFRSDFDKSYDYDLILRYTNIAKKIVHIPKLLYFNRELDRKTVSDIGTRMESISAAEKALSDYLNKHKKTARVESIIGLPRFFRVYYELNEKPLISIIIPNKDNASMLQNCIFSILEKTTYPNYEIIIVENNSSEDSTFALYKELSRNINIRIITWKGKGFNFSEICNFGVQQSNGQHIIFLNNDVLIISPYWIEEMLMYDQRDDVGAVGAKLYYLNGSIQHAGVVLGLGDIAGHVFHGASHDTVGYMGKLQIVQNMSVVTAACMMIKKKVFNDVEQFSTEFPNSFNDVDLCLKIRKAGLLIVWTPYAEAYHIESRSRGYNTTSSKKHSLAMETDLFKVKWEEELEKGDPYYNCNFTLDRMAYTFR
ncbi:MAG: glycosyltransferase family 2 protein [Treponema sp.]|nr:glycosyltransferase family 2 protein [Treponema sp.]